MLLKLQNIGKIKEAAIKLDGLTVIGGVNDTGKSTVGKVLFSVVKGENKYQKIISEKSKDKFLEEVYIKPMTIAQQNQNNAKDYAELLSKEKITDEDIPLIKKYFLEMKRSLNFPQLQTNLTQFADTLKQEIKTPLSEILQSEFQNQITNKMLDKVAILKLINKNNSLIDFTLEKDKIKKINEVAQIPFADAVIIDTPIVLLLADILEEISTPFDSSDYEKRNKRISSVPYHFKDLVIKIKNSRLFEEQQDKEYLSLIEDIVSVISGSFEYDSDKDTFYYQKRAGKDNKLAINMINTATGVKVFGIIQMLLKSGMIGKDSVLIIDEPEVHLHPAWQVKFGEIITHLVKAGITVLLTSHSPYLIQSVKKYSELNQIAPQTYFYFAENSDDGTSSISDVTEDLNKLFTSLSEPLQKIIWE